MRTLADFSRLNMVRCPEKIAVTLDSQRLSYRALDADSSRLAAALATSGIGVGDRVAVMAFNCPEFVVVFQAVAKLGAILVPINVRLSAAEIAAVAQHCRPKAVFIESPFWAEAATPLAAAGAALFLMRSDGSGPVADMTQMMAGQPAAFAGPAVEPSSCAAIMYTSGTTGRAKGVMISHEHYLRIFVAIAIEMEVRESDILQVAVPLFHNGGFASVLGPGLMLGAGIVCHRGSFDPALVLGDIARHRISVTHWVPTMLATVLPIAEQGGHDLSSLQRIHYGAMPISPSLLARARAAFPQAAFFQGYGTTDAGLIACLRPEHHHDHPGCTGRPVFNTRSRIVDSGGGEVAEGGIGEVVVDAATSGMMGYWGDETATRAAIRDGWIHTGDMARRDADGFFTLVERKNFMIISGGENIYPREVEDVLATHPDIAEVSVIGVKDAKFGEAVCAVVVAASGAAPSLEDIRAHCEGRIARYKFPRHLLLLPEMPRTAVGKIAKAALTEIFEHQRGAP